MEHASLFTLCPRVSSETLEDVSLMYIQSIFKHMYTTKQKIITNTRTRQLKIRENNMMGKEHKTCHKHNDKIKMFVFDLIRINDHIE